MEVDSQKSCWGCKYLYGDGDGYSNYTWMETYARCALGRNPNLIQDKEIPYAAGDKMPQWAPIKDTRCEMYSECLEMITLDPDRECWPPRWPDEVIFEPLSFMDQESLDAIWKSDGVKGDPLPLSEYMRGGMKGG